MNDVVDNGIDMVDAFDVRYDPVAEAEAILASIGDDAGTEVVETGDRELIYA